MDNSPNSLPELADVERAKIELAARNFIDDDLGRLLEMESVVDRMVACFVAGVLSSKNELPFDPLPCDVRLPPATTIRAGCKLETLLLALSVEGRPKHFAEALSSKNELPSEIEGLVERWRACIRSAQDVGNTVTFRISTADEMVNAILSLQRRLDERDALLREAGTLLRCTFGEHDELIARIDAALNPKDTGR
jgi:hypothetical protein